jgi:hypothetical protein
MDKVTIFIIILFWVISAVFKAVQKKETQKRKEPFSVPPVSGDRIPSEREEPFFQEESDQNRMIQINDLYNILEPQNKVEQEVPPAPISLEEPIQGKHVSLEELFIRSASKIPTSSPPSEIPLGEVPPIIQEESETTKISKASGNLEKKTFKNGIFEWGNNLSPWQRAVVLHEILQPPKSMRRK